MPAIAAALVSAAIVGGPSDSSRFFATVFLASALAITLSFALYVALGRTLFPDLGKYEIRTFVEDLPSTVLNVLLVVAGAGITVRLGNAGIAFALSAVLRFPIWPTCSNGRAIGPSRTPRCPGECSADSSERSTLETVALRGTPLQSPGSLATWPRRSA